MNEVSIKARREAASLILRHMNREPKIQGNKYLAMFNKTTMEMLAISLTRDQLENKMTSLRREGKDLTGFEEKQILIGDFE